jgi:hypothetical protein
VGHIEGPENDPMCQLASWEIGSRMTGTSPPPLQGADFCK